MVHSSQTILSEMKTHVTYTLTRFNTKNTAPLMMRVHTLVCSAFRG